MRSLSVVLLAAGTAAFLRPLAPQRVPVALPAKRKKNKQVLSPSGEVVRGRQMMRASAIIANRGRSSLVSAPWLSDHLNDPKLRILDVTQALDRTGNTVSPGVDAYRAAHIPGARFVDVGRRLSTPNAKLHNMAPSPEQFAAELSRQGVDDGNHVVLYSSGKVMWATRVWWLLNSFGFEGRVSVLDGGLKAWTAAGGGTATFVPKPTPTTLPIRPARRTAFVDKDAVLKAMETDTTLVDTLKPSSFDGSKPSRYGRRGHIATATNVPYESLLDEAGCFLPEDELRRAFAAAGVGDEPVLAY
jgi:thiosulfate/3-mercaptopyruvate sulfurtransferase